MVVFDSSFLIFLFVPNAPCAVDRARDRIDFLIGDLHGKGERIRVPAPALSEILIRTGHSTQQIVAIAKVLDASVIYSEDEELRKLASANGITAKSLADCRLPYNKQESNLELFPKPKEGEES
jgi:hypothetical protein